MVKSYNHLFEKVISDYNLSLAIDNATAGKDEKSGAKDRAEHIQKNKVQYIKKIKQMLLNQEFKAKKHRADIFYDHTSYKYRLILKPDLEDEQIIHWAVIQVLQPIFMRGMYEYSCGSIPGRGPHYGKKAIEKFIHRHPADCKYVLEFDIKKFYPSIDTDILKQKLRRIIHDEKMMFLLEQIIDSNIAVFEDGHEERVGVPIGYYTSQWFGNFYLQDLDHYIKQDLKAAGLFRYVDNVEIFGRNKKELHKSFNLIKFELSKLKLKVKENYQLYRFDYIDKKDGKRKGRFVDFMGFRFYRDKTTIRRATMLKATRKARKMSKKPKITAFDSCQLMSRLGVFKHTNTRGVFEKHIKPYVNIKNCRQAIRTRQLKINKNKEKKQCSTSENQKVLKNPSNSTKQVPKPEFISESTCQLTLFPIMTETKE
ncbi:TPA: hypothetical protein CPT87_07175 [Candidatus Gastranaerophilales bacterium HUM_5]|nr:MAG TPA: hypothetical protein CPT99_09890 [Candidatus Gastranaerophilales bacterium HUM_4]DAA90990.1 MAG TPA: hypothetical protein CPT87_07175 [Candidatus Gastranaerophilales bacterium HUM_5]